MWDVRMGIRYPEYQTETIGRPIPHFRVVDV
jgi:hypothetical protein